MADPSDMVTPSLVRTRAVKVQEYAQSRAKELSYFSKLLLDKKATRRVFQRLPRHLRRRAMSHNPYLIPLRLRKEAMKEMVAAPQKSENIKFRKHRRRPANIMEVHARRRRKHKWLETHIWHAKRMRMKDLWGYRLADYPTDKSWRSLYRAAMHHCVVHDASYESCYQLTGSQQSLLDLLHTCTDPKAVAYRNASVLKGCKEADFLLCHANQFPVGVIAPTRLLWMAANSTGAQTTRQLWLWVHPAASIEALDMLQKVSPMHQVEVRPLDGELVRFELRGPLALQVLSRVLQTDTDTSITTADTTTTTTTTTASSSSSSCSSSSAWASLCGLRTAATMPPNAVLSLRVKDPRLLRFASQQQRTHTSTGASSSSSAAQRVSPPTPSALLPVGLTSLLLTWPASLCQSQLWSESYREQMLLPIHKVVTRSPKRRLPKLLEAIKRNPARLTWLTTFKKPATTAQLKRPLSNGDAMNVESNAGSAVNSSIESVQTEPSVEVLVVQRPGALRRGFGSGLDLIVPAGWGMPFWKALVFGGARAMGLRERRRLHVEQGVACFPFDYPETNAYRSYTESEQTRLAAKYNRTPPAKRVNYAAIGRKDPFFCNWASLFMASSDQVGTESYGGSTPPPVVYHVNRGTTLSTVDSCLIQVQIRFTASGVPAENAMIYEPSADDYSLLANPHSRQVIIESDHVTIRKPLGYITTGTFSYARGTGWAVGFVTATCLQELSQNVPSLRMGRQGAKDGGRYLVLVRNATSRFFHPAFLHPNTPQNIRS